MVDSPRSTLGTGKLARVNSKRAIVIDRSEGAVRRRLVCCIARCVQRPQVLRVNVSHIYLDYSLTVDDIVGGLADNLVGSEKAVDVASGLQIRLLLLLL
jgi:hypothetical protein